MDKVEVRVITPETIKSICEWCKGELMPNYGTEGGFGIKVIYENCKTYLWPAACVIKMPNNTFHYCAGTELIETLKRLLK